MPNFVAKSVNGALFCGAIMAVTLSAGGCSGSESAGLFSGAGGNGFYGNFCGYSYPKIKEDGGPVVSQLEAIPAIDDLDAACKGHDICYAAGNMSKSACDLALVRYLTTARWSQHCEITAQKIVQAFPVASNELHKEGRNAKERPWNLATPIEYIPPIVGNILSLPLGVLPRRNEPCNNLNKGTQGRRRSYSRSY